MILTTKYRIESQSFIGCYIFLRSSFFSAPGQPPTNNTIFMREMTLRQDNIYYMLLPGFENTDSCILGTSLSVCALLNVCGFLASADRSGHRSRMERQREPQMVMPPVHPRATRTLQQQCTPTTKHTRRRRRKPIGSPQKTHIFLSPLRFALCDYISILS